MTLLTVSGLALAQAWLHVLSFAGERFIAFERRLFRSYEELLSSPYFPFFPDDLRNPFTGKEPIFLVLERALPGAERGQFVLYLQDPPILGISTGKDLLWRVLPSPRKRWSRKEIRQLLLPGDRLSRYLALDALQKRLYWQCAYLNLRIQEEGFPDPSEKEFRRKLEAWFRDRYWFPVPLREPTALKPYRWTSGDRKKEPGQVTLRVTKNRRVLQCFGPGGFPVMPWLEKTRPQRGEVFLP